mgnify:CR=1 FL=1
MILGYAALPEEIQTDGILRRALAEGKALYLPRCLDDAGQMAFYRVQALEELEDKLDAAEDQLEWTFGIDD